MTKLSYEQVAEELKQELGDRANITMTYEQLKVLSGYERFSERFYEEVGNHGSNIGIVIGFGYNVVTIATDTNPTSERPS